MVVKSVIKMESSVHLVSDGAISMVVSDISFHPSLPTSHKHKF